MDLKQLEYFVHAAEFGNVSRAASFMGVSQPALSRQIRLLEVELRQSLLIRNGRGVALTDAGRRLLTYGVAILQQVDHAKHALEEDSGALVGNVSVGIPPSVGRLMTVALVKEFQRRFPKARLRVAEGLSAHIEEWLKLGTIDIGLLYNPVPSEAIETFPLMEEPLYLMSPAPPGSESDPIGPPVALVDLPNYPLVLPGRPHNMRMLLETQMARAGLKISIVCEIDSIPVIRSLVSQGIGHAVLAFNAVRATRYDGVLQRRRIVEPDLCSVLTLARSQLRPNTPLVSSTVVLLEEVLSAQTPASGQPE
jgi:LysR family nitrogen assimilation transcriptional regulator